MSGKKSANPPYWTPVLLMAKEYSTPPWEIEENLSLKWLKRWLSYRVAENMERERLEKKRKRGTN